MVIRSIAGDRLVHPGIQEDVFIGDIEALAEAGLIRISRRASGTINFDVRQRGLKAAESMDENQQSRSTGRLTGGEVSRIVYGYIGVSGGYLGDFSYSKLAEFFTVNCDLELDNSASEGTSRERFMYVLQSSPPHIQARILRALLERNPQPTATGPVVMQPEEVLRLVSRLEGLPVPASSPVNASEAVRRALADAESLLNSQTASSAVDRVHTALHGYARNLCDQSGIGYEESDTVQKLLKLISLHHPRLQEDEQVATFISGILGPLGTVVDRINEARNTRSLAHPNDNLLGESEAMLVINIVRTLLHYLEAKLS